MLGSNVFFFFFFFFLVPVWLSWHHLRGGDAHHSQDQHQGAPRQLLLREVQLQGSPQHHLLRLRVQLQLANQDPGEELLREGEGKRREKWLTDRTDYYQFSWLLEGNLGHRGGYCWTELCFHSLGSLWHNSYHHSRRRVSNKTTFLFVLFSLTERNNFAFLK